MTTRIVALFSSQAESTAAIDEMADKELDFDSQVIEAWDELRETEAQPPTPAVNPNPTGQAAVMPPDLTFSSLGVTEEELAFFERGVKKGGVLLVVDAENGDVDKVRGILDEHNGRMAVKD